MTQPIIDRLLSSIAQRTGAGLFAELDEIDPCAVDEVASDTQQLEFDEIPLHDAVETCHRIAERMRMYE
jgi:hypothetical protein